MNPTPEELKQITNLIRSADDKNKFLGVTAARALQMDPAELLEIILNCEWKKRNVYRTYFEQSLFFLNLSFCVHCFYFLTNPKDKKTVFTVTINEEHFFKKNVEFNCLGKNEIFIKQTIKLLIDRIKLLT
jgi:hypothetical protein